MQFLTGTSTHANPGKLVFGPGAIEELPKVLNENDKPLIITDGGVVEAGVSEKVAKVLETAGMKYSFYSDVASDPPIKIIEEAANVYYTESCNSIIGLGGGSCMDAAKAVAVVVTTGEGIECYRDGRMVSAKLVPIIAIPTTAGTGSEVTGVTVISDTQNKIKLAIKGKPLIPEVAVLDPELLLGIPPRIAAATGSDALIHAIEAFLSKKSNPITDCLALQAIRMISRHLRLVSVDTLDLESQGEMLLGSCIAGLAFSNAGLGLVHSLGHPLGAFYHVSHGLACALYLLPVLRFNMPLCEEKLGRLAEAMGEDVRNESPVGASKRALMAVEELMADIEMPLSIADLGLGEFVLHEKMIQDAFEAAPTKVNPRSAALEDIRFLFESVM